MKKRTRKAKPVKAWAIVDEKGKFVMDNQLPLLLNNLHQANWNVIRNERIARVEVREVKK